MKNVKKFNTPSEANGYVINNIPFICNIFEEDKDDQLLWCDDEDKKIVVDENNHATIVDKYYIEFVDLGLSVNWGKWNIGATNETEPGNYYAWGEIETKTDYSWNTYIRHTNGTAYSPKNKKIFIKYCPLDKESTYWYGAGPADNLTILESVDDVVTQTLGKNYRMPTEEDFNNLFALPHTWINKNGINGYEFNGNGNTLFIPAAGLQPDLQPLYIGTYGRYWTSNLHQPLPQSSRQLSFNSTTVEMFNGDRNRGYTIRPVCPK